ncbi:DUF4920 domain-containing protein [Runella salmonicolor]|uniref:DUF4920 domain-containing protein n=1 Tax=Runella salmonicolor TaxID=2950278 RepID=A0ABT1FR73_9BACT|nr:DUF4920 domain-containing protein [Runella salmonicolor]MCP1384270.1 DUF4920 domain-containing protein [Runella salmonicolor]
MKNILITALFTLFVAGAYAQESYFGKKINDKGALASAELPKKMAAKEKMSAKVVGTVESVCQAKGCWMKVKTADGQTMRVSFKDYGFFVPKDIAGKTVVFEGEAKMKTTPVAELQHYAEDAGKSKEDIAKITEPKHELTFVADGVIVKK